MSTLTILAAHLAALGFEEGDSPVQTRGGSAIAHNAWAHTIANAPRVHLSVEQSAPTLLRALARQYGARLEPGEAPRWWRSPLGPWWLDWDVSQGSRVFVPPGYEVGDWMEAVPALTADMGRLEALAAVIAWRAEQ